MIPNGIMLDRLERRRVKVLMELHPELRKRLVLLLADLGGRLTPWEGYRGPTEQAAAKATGASNASFGESPHNFRPALACDLVLHPTFVDVRPNPVEPRLPDLWDSESPDALAAWAALELAAKEHGLERVDVNGKRDLPHLQLHGWKSLVPQ